MRCHRRAGRGVGDAIGAHEAEFAVFDHRHRQSRHFGTLRQVGELPVERGIVDPAAPFGRRVGQIFGGLDRNRDAGKGVAAAQGMDTEPAGRSQRGNSDQNGKNALHGLDWIATFYLAAVIAATCTAVTPGAVQGARWGQALNIPTA